MACLDDVVRGAAQGAALVVDPFGASYALRDLHIAGIGPGNRRSYPSLFTEVTRELYDGEESSIRAYLSRGVGLLGGTILGAATFGLLAAASPLALAIPVTTGIYATLRFYGRYLHDMTLGENEAKVRTKASFYDGFRYGWHYVTDSFSRLLQNFESFLSGRDYQESRLESSVKEASGRMRRNARGIIGRWVGKATGAITETGLGVAGYIAAGSIAGPVGSLVGAVLGVTALPLYKLGVALYRTFTGRRVKRRRPRHAQRRAR